ncbi:MAG TPA: tail fiber protein [Candidatus Dormibacteraeota bacterium]|nr:tail fiber protein [Candidatus Dormibacteraeota bacterium]
MASPYLAEIRIFSCNFAPKGWAMCNGQLLPINQNQALFSLLGTTYGGNGQTTFALPDLQGRVPFHMGSGFTLGQSGGETVHALIPSELPVHTHPVTASSNVGDQVSPAGNYWAKGIASAYTRAGAINGSMAPSAVTSAGGFIAHENMSPYLVLNICIALAGIFPSRN